MRPSFLDNMSWAMAEVYGAVTDQILVNLARHFPYIKKSPEARDIFEYQARMLAQMGQVNRETADIIVQSLGGADAALRQALEAAIVDALKYEEPALRKAAQKGLLNGAGALPPEVTPNQLQAFQAYYQQSADKLNLINTVMLESTQAAYTATVADAAARIGRTQSIINVGAGEVVTGVSNWNQAMHDAVKKMVINGLTGFIDHAGRRWSPEAYVAMDIRTTMFNTARAAVWERSGSYGADLYQVSSHNGARPLCYPWQGKVISRSGTSGETEDLNGNKIRVYAQGETSIGQAAGLFGVNCRHYPMTFIPKFSTLKGQPQDPEENAEAYELSQQQRGLERKLREERRDLAVLKAQGAGEDEIRVQQQRVSAASSRIDEFCDEHGLPRRKNREYTPIDAKFPPDDSFDPAQFPTEQRDKMKAHFEGETAAPVETAPQPARDATNIFGEEISFSDKMSDPKWDTSKETIRKLATEYKTKLKEVMPGAEHGAGDVQISGTIMRLSSTKQSDAIHEFAHSISIENQTKFGLYDEGEFWREIRSIRTAYRKATRDDTSQWISGYEHSHKEIDEFMAEAFTLGYMREKGLKIPEKYGNDTVFSARVLDAVKRYFSK